MTALSIVVSVLVLGGVIVAVVESRDNIDPDTSALPKTLGCRVTPVSDPANAGVNADRPPTSVIASSGSVELFAENRLQLDIDFAGQLPPPVQTVGTAQSNYPLGTTYGFTIDFDDHAISLDGDTDEGWSLTEYHGDEVTTIDTLPNVTVGPNSVSIILELEKFSSMPAVLDPTVEISSARFPGPLQDVILYPYQVCE